MLVADIDSANFDTGALTVSIPSGGEPAEDVLSIRNQGTGAGQIGVSGSNVTYGGVTIGTYTGGANLTDLAVTFNSNATPTAVTALVKNITYQDVDTNNPTPGSCTIRFVLTDGDGGTSANYDTTVTIAAVNDAPTITNLSGDSLAYSEGDGAVVIEQSGNALVADVDCTNFDTGTLTVSIPAGGDSAEDVLSIQNQGTGAGQIGVSGSNVTYGGVTIGTFTGGSGGSNLVITLNASATPTAVTALVQHITYQDTDTNAPTTGARTVRYVLTDGDGGASANYDTTVTVNAVNDAPVLTPFGPVFNITEGAASVSANVSDLLLTSLTDVDGGAVEGIAIFGISGSGATVEYSLDGTTWLSLGSVSGTSALLLRATDLLRIIPDTDNGGTLHVDYRGWDQTAGTAGTKVNASVTGGTTAFSSASDQAVANITSVNDAPTDLALSANTVAENVANGTVVGTVSGTDVDTGDTKTYSLTDTAGGRFAINSSTGVITVANGSLLNYEAASSHSVTVRVTDSGGLTYDEAFTINLTNVNEAPTGTDATVTISEDTSHTLTTANFGFSDVDAGDALSAVRIDTLPGSGTMTLSGVAVTAGQVVTVANINAGNLVFTPAANANGVGYANVTFSVRDAASTYDAAPNTLTFNVTAVNDASTITNLNGDSLDYTEGDGAVVIEQSEQRFGGGRRLSRLQHRHADRLIPGR